MAIVKELDTNKVIAKMTFEQDTYFETEEGVFLTPDFYQVYKILLILYSDEVQTLESEKEFYTKKKPITYLLHNEEIESSLAEKLQDFHEENENESKVIVQNTDLLQKMMEMFKKDNLVMSYYLTGRQQSDGYDRVSVPEDVAPLFETLGLYVRNMSSSSSYDDEMFDFRYDREAVLKKRLPPWRALDEGEVENIEEDEYSVVTKVSTQLDIFGASKILPLLGEHYWGDRIIRKEEPGIGELPPLDEILMRANVSQRTYSFSSDYDPEIEVKEAFLKRVTNDDRNKLATYFSGDFIFSPLVFLGKNLRVIFNKEDFINRFRNYSNDYQTDASKRLLDKSYWSHRMFFGTGVSQSIHEPFKSYELNNSNDDMASFSNGLILEEIMKTKEITDKKLAFLKSMIRYE